MAIIGRKKEWRGERNPKAPRRKYDGSTCLWRRKAHDIEDSTNKSEYRLHCYGHLDVIFLFFRQNRQQLWRQLQATIKKTILRKTKTRISWKEILHCEIMCVTTSTSCREIRHCLEKRIEQKCKILLLQVAQGKEVHREVAYKTSIFGFYLLSSEPVPAIFLFRKTGTDRMQTKVFAHYAERKVKMKCTSF